MQKIFVIHKTQIYLYLKLRTKQSAKLFGTKKIQKLPSGKKKSYYWDSNLTQMSLFPVDNGIIIPHVMSFSSST